MFTISTRTRTAFLAEALRCLRDVLPWLVVLLALCVETFYAPESPALVALYLTAGISVTATLDIPQSATASSKAPCHQCTQPVATVDATCSTVTAPWNTLHSSAGAGPSDAAPCPSPPAPQEPAALAPWMPVTSLLPPYTSTALQLSTPMPAASQQPAPLPALAAAPLRPQPHHLRASAAAALAARAAKRSLSSCGPLAGTARTSRRTAEAKAKAVINISASATMNMDLNTAHHHSRSSILDVLPWLVVLLALCVETFYAPESPALVALYLTAGISVTATLDIPQSATASSKAPCHQCTQPVATVDATCSTVTAPWNTLHSSAGAGPSDAAPCPSPPAPQEPAALAPWMPVTSLLPPYTSTALQLSTPMPAASQQPAPLPALAAAPLRPQPHHLRASAAAALAARAAKRSLSSCGPLAGTARTSRRTAEAKAKAVINISASATMNMDLNTAHHHSRSSILDVLPWLVVLLALCVETFYAPESPALVALYLTAGISVTATLDIPQSATASSKAPCHQCTQPAATVDVTCDATCSTVTAPWNTLHSSAGAGPSDAAPCPSPPAPQEPAALAPWMPVTSLLPPYTSTALQLSTPMPAASQQPAPLPALAAAPLRPQPHHLRASAAAALAARAAKRSLSSCGPLAGTARTSRRTAEAKAKAVINISASATMNMDLNTAHHHSRSSILDVLPWLVVLLALCVETFYAPESPALVALYLTAGISVTATLDIPQSATASSKAPCHQCTQPAATVDVTCDATCSTVTAPWNTLHSSAGAGPSNAAPCPSPPAPQEPAALAPWMSVTSLLPPYTSTALQLSTPMPAASQQPAPLPALAAAPLRPQPHHLRASAAAALAARAAKRSLSSCGPLAGTARTSRC
ncbi:hypothetical protein QJQ45_001214 [Haematococcus lacustris]|nr:hypothetical protein QJQ45_001214 [Haematococcus lacustris]